MPGLRILYGGTFDPIHNGHLAVARAAAEAFDAPVSLLPAADPPHREPPLVDAATRARLVALAVEGHPQLSIDRRELERGGRSYSVDTVAGFRAESGPDAPLAWLLGEDAFAGFSRWHQWQRLFPLCHWLVAIRPGPDGSLAQDPGDVEASWPDELRAVAGRRWVATADELRQSPGGRLARLILPARPESSTAIRDAIAHGDPWTQWVPPAVAAEIRRNHLYARPGGRAPAGI